MGINLIECMMPADQVVQKSFIEDFKHKSRLIVDDSQVAIFYKDGNALDQFGAGDHALDTNNLPLLTKIVNKVLGIQSVFSCHVYFVKKVSFFSGWGTRGVPAKIKDPSTGISCDVRANGQAVYHIIDGDERRFIAKVVGQETTMSIEDVKDKVRNIIGAFVKNALSNSIQSSRTPITEVQGRSIEISADVRAALNVELKDYGLELEKFFISDFEFDENDYAKIEASESRRLEVDDEAYKMHRLGYTYQDERKFDVLETAAKNEGPQSGFMNMGIGLGMGMNMAREMGGMMGSVAATAQQGGASQAQGITCPVCKASLPAGAKFCASCGEKIESQQGTICPACGMSLPAGAKFCSGCGQKIEQQTAIFCDQCGTKCEAGAKFCPSCGNKLGDSIKKV